MKKYYPYILFAAVLLVSSIAYIPVYHNYKFVGDGALYTAMAESFLQQHAFRDITYIPDRPFFTVQVGISSVLALWRFVLGQYWLAGYLVTVSVVWSVALLEIRRLVLELGLGEKTAALVSVILFLQPDAQLATINLNNEALWTPMLYAAMAGFLRGVLTPSAAVPALFPASSWRGVMFVAFTLLSPVFRIQALAGLATMGTACLLYARPKLPRFITLSCAAVAVFAAVAWWMRDVSPAADCVMAKLSRNSLDLEAAAYNFLAQAGFELQSVRLFPPTRMGEVSPPGWILAGVGMALALALFVMAWRRQRRLVVIALAAYGWNWLFLAYFSFIEQRYFLPFNFFLTLVAAVALRPTIARVSRWVVAGGAAAMMLPSLVAVGAYLLPHLEFWPRHYQSGTMLAVHRDLARQGIPDRALVYSSDARMTYWVLGRRSCLATPETCARLQGLDHPDGLVYIGSRLVLKGLVNKGAKVYRLGPPLLPVRDNLGAWWLVEDPETQPTPYVPSGCNTPTN